MNTRLPSNSYCIFIIEARYKPDLLLSFRRMSGHITDTLTDATSSGYFSRSRVLVISTPREHRLACRQSDKSMSLDSAYNKLSLFNNAHPAPGEVPNLSSSPLETSLGDRCYAGVKRARFSVSNNQL